MSARIFEGPARGTWPRVLAVIAVGALAACAGQYPNYPITQHGVLFPAIDASVPKSA